MTTAKDILNLIKEKDVKYVDVRFTDVRGKMQHVTFDIDLVDDDFLNDGTMFDGSSIAGWKAINESDMKLRPDLDSAIIDPFYQQTTLALFCDVVNPDSGTPYNRDPRSIAKAALNYVKSAGVDGSAQHQLLVRLDRTAGELGQGISGRQHGPPPGPEGRLLPGEPGRQLPGPARRNAGRHGRAGHEAGKAPPRGGPGPARTRPEVRHHGHHGRPDAAL
jgi:hypothetical protein